MYQVVHRNKKAVGLTVALFLGNSASGCPHNKKAIGLTVALSWATQHKVVHSNKKAVGLTVALFLATMHQVVHRNLVSIVLLPHIRNEIVALLPNTFLGSLRR